jgi:6-phosphogluconolactonase
MGNWQLNIVVDQLPALRQRLAAEYVSRSVDALTTRGTFIIALPGGSVAEAFLPTFADLPVEWVRTDVFWIDERAVPPDHTDSNYALASRLFLQPAGVTSPHVHRMQGELVDLDEAARRASHELSLVAGSPPRIDIALVGVGEDGHVASLFEGGPGFVAGESHVIAIDDSPKPPPRRLTMTLPVLANAALVIVAGFGQSKARVVHHAMHDAGSSMPVGRLLRSASSSMVLLDSAYSH